MNKRRRIQASWPGEEQPGCKHHLQQPTLVSSLLRREQGLLTPQRCCSLCIRRSFLQFSCQGSFDSHDEKVAPYLPLESMQHRSRISEMVIGGPYLFALSSNGMCPVYKKDDPSTCLCFLNGCEGELVRSLFLNKAQGAIIAVSGQAQDGYAALHCRSVPLKFQRPSKTPRTNAVPYWRHGTPIFTHDSLQGPGGFVEFCENSHKALLYDGVSQLFKIYSLATYELLYTVPGGSEGASDVKISWNYLLAVGQAPAGQLPLTVLSLASGQVLARQNLPLQAHASLDLLDLYDSKVLARESKGPLRIYDVLSLELLGMSNHECLTAASTFLYCHESNLFITVTGSHVAAWNFKAQMVAGFEDCVLWLPDMHSDLVYLAGGHDLIICYCKASSCAMMLPEATAVGSINVSRISSGKCIAKLEDFGDPARAAALNDVTAVLYDEDDHAIYAGTHQGIVYKWSNAGVHL